jgi:RNA polymerase sigma-70 factor (ECF subfamily)
MLRSDAELVAMVLTGAHDRYNELVRRYKNLITAFCYSRVRQRETAEDLAQDVFVRGFSALSRLKRPAAFSGWLLTIAHNVCVDYMRNKSRTVSLETDGAKDSRGEIILESPNSDNVVERVAEGEIRAEILKAIDELPDEYRITLILRHVNGFSCEEVAATLDVSLGTVTSRLSRAHQILRRRLSMFADPDEHRRGAVGDHLRAKESPGT